MMEDSAMRRADRSHSFSSCNKEISKSSFLGPGLLGPQLSKSSRQAVEQLIVRRHLLDSSRVLQHAGLRQLGLQLTMHLSAYISQQPNKHPDAPAEHEQDLAAHAAEAAGVAAD